MSLLVFKSSPGGSQKKPLIIVVSAKVSKKATERNLIKRRIRAIMKPIIEKTNKDYLIIVKPEIKTLSFQQLKGEIQRIVNFQ